jgi:nitrilase
MAVSARFGRDLQLCMAQVKRTIAHARERDAALVVLPESALGGYLYEPRIAGAPLMCAPLPALHRDGEEIARIARLAGDVVVCIGYTEDAPGGPYSSAVCVNGDGVLGHHRKVHLPPGERLAFGPASRRSKRRSAASGCSSATTRRSPRRRANSRSTARA